MGSADFASLQYANIIFSLYLTYEGRAPLFKARSGNRGKAYHRMNVNVDVDLLGPSSGHHLLHLLHFPSDVSRSMVVSTKILNHQEAYLKRQLRV